MGAADTTRRKSGAIEEKLMSRATPSVRLTPHRAVPPDVVQAIRAVSERRLTEMYDRETVMMLAAAIGFEAEAEWLVEHRHLYFIALELSRAAADVPSVGRLAHAS